MIGVLFLIFSNSMVTVKLRYCKSKKCTLCLHHNCECRLPPHSVLQNNPWFSERSFEDGNQMFQPQTQEMNHNSTYKNILHYTLLLTFLRFILLPLTSSLEKNSFRFCTVAIQNQDPMGRFHR